ncbi:hypothetical protein, partial [Mycolicibacterium setense]|uniref:hypothetical protein n=1 Tax=Mycolicibacterium setense TaxID=431269 RepID=UPI0021F3B51A
RVRRKAAIGNPDRDPDGEPDRKPDGKPDGNVVAVDRGPWLPPSTECVSALRIPKANGARVCSVKTSIPLWLNGKLVGVA